MVDLYTRGLLGMVGMVVGAGYAITCAAEAEGERGYRAERGQTSVGV